MTRVLIRDRRAESQTQRGSHVEMEAETGTWTQAQGRLEPPEAGRGRKELPWGLSGKRSPALLGPQTCGL